jgi:hypothetical protein
VSAPRPEPHTPSEAIEEGLCPGCLGSGWVVRFVPVEHEGPCSTCGGTGTWPPDEGEEGP